MTANLVWAGALLAGVALLLVHSPLAMNPRYDWIYTVAVMLLWIALAAALFSASA